MRALVLTAVVVLSIPATAIAAQPGTLDRSFGGDGRVETRVPGGLPGVAGIEALPGGKLLLAGTVGDRKVVLIRYRRDGTLDKRFGRKGVRSYAFDRDVIASKTAIDGEGRILVAGALGSYSDPARDALVLRFDRAGRPDSTFDGDGIALVDFGGADAARALAVQSDRHIAIAALVDRSGSGDLGVARLDQTGRVDTGFGEGGVVRMTHHDSGDNIDPAAVAAHPDGRLAVGVNYGSYKGNAPWILSLGADGTPGAELQLPAGADEASIADLALRGSSGPLLFTGSGSPARGGNFSLWFGEAGTTTPAALIPLGLDQVWGSRLAFDGAGRTVVAGSTYREQDRPLFETAEIRDMVVARFSRKATLTRCFGKDGVARVGFPGRSSTVAAVTAAERSRIVIAGPAPSVGSKRTPQTFQLARLNNGRCPRS